MQTGRSGISILAKAQNNALFLRLHLIKTGQGPQQKGDGSNTPEAFFTDIASPATAFHNIANLVLAFFQQSLNILRFVFVLLRLPRIVVIIV